MVVEWEVYEKSDIVVGNEGVSICTVHQLPLCYHWWGRDDQLT